MLACCATCTLSYRPTDARNLKVQKIIIIIITDWMLVSYCLIVNSRSITMEMETATLKSVTVSTNHEVKKSSDTSSMEKRGKIYVWLCGVLTLTPIILIILVLLSLPTVFFYTSKRKSQSAVRIISMLSTSHMVAVAKFTWSRSIFFAVVAEPFSIPGVVISFDGKLALQQFLGVILSLLASVI